MSLAVLARHGRTFRLAGRLLPQAILASAAELYAFCRAVDDLADETPDRDAARDELVALRRALLAGTGTHLLAAQFARLHLGTGASHEAAVALIDTVLKDLDPVRLPDEPALLQYAYGAAGTVGAMMCTVLGAEDPRATAHGISLGVAMQLTNIARDVVEDAARDRLYLPASWLPPGLRPHGITDAPEPVFAAVRRVLTLADDRYRHAELGHQYLPPRVRPAIRTAARLYEEIGLRVLQRGPAHLQAGRCVVPMSRKLILLAGCLSDRRPAVVHGLASQAAMTVLPRAHV